MNCPECDHENTEGAWLCINCGAKLPRAEEAEREAAEESESVEEPSRFEPTISENLRRLRERTASGASTKPSRPRRAGERPTMPGLPKLPGGAVFGFAPTFWLIFAALLVVIALTLSSFQ
jgi:hypothetical protein